MVELGGHQHCISLRKVLIYSVLGNGMNEGFGVHPNLIWIKISPFMYSVNLDMFYKPMGLSFLTSNILPRRWWYVYISFGDILSISHIYCCLGTNENMKQALGHLTGQGEGSKLKRREHQGPELKAPRGPSGWVTLRVVSSSHGFFPSHKWKHVSYLAGLTWEALCVKHPAQGLAHSRHAIEVLGALICVTFMSINE